MYFGFGTAPGVVIQTRGAVSITGLNSHDNVYGGIRIGDPNASPDPIIAGAVTLTDTGASNNGDFGIQIYSNNAITWKIGWSGGNGTYGALLDNTSATSAKAVTLETGWFYGNQDGNGLEVQSKGAVTLKNVNAGDNYGYGIFINNNGGTANVSVTGTSAQWLDIGRNGEAGLYIESRGAVSASYISAYENGQVNDQNADGIHIRNVDALTPKTVTASNLDTWNNRNKGVHISSKGAITVTNISARDNVGEGAFFENTVSGGVKVLRTAYWHNDFSRNGEEGLFIIAMGPVTLARINAYENGWIYYEDWYTGDPFDGVHIDNCWAGSGDTCAGKWGVTLLITSGWNHDFSRNSQFGLYISSGGAVKMANVNAGENGGFGLLVDTNWLNAAGAVTLNTVGDATNNFWNNGFDGALICASGAIIVSNFQANENGRHGLNLGNRTALTPAPITVTNGNADNNRNGHGIYARSLGNIKLVDVDAQNNDVHYTSIAFDTTVPEKLQGWLYDWDASSWGEGDVYEFEVDEDGGTLAVEVHAALEFQGVVTLEVWDDVNEEWDFVEECNDVTECTISNASLPNGLYRARITGIDWDNQGNYLVSLNDDDTGYTSYDYIGGSGLWLSNDYAGATGTVTVANGPNRGYVNTHNNGSTGTFIRSHKAISITRLDSSNNGGLGLDADNCLYNGSVCLYVAPVTINGYSSNLSDNQMGGISMSSGGVVYLQNVDAGNNHRGDGAHIFAGNLTIKATNPQPWMSGFNYNGGNGLWLYSNGTVTLDRVYSSNNGGQGLWLSNTAAATPKAVSISNAYFNDNQDASLDTAGLEVWSKGAVTLKSVDVSNNASGGAYINNTAGSLGVTIQQSTFNNNQAGSGADNGLWDGIFIDTNGNVLWTSSSAGGNGGGDGAQLNTGGSVTVLATYGNNDFSFNSQSGLGLIGIASANVNGVRGGGNGNRGLIIATDTAGAITVSNSLFNGNSAQGVLIANDGTGLIKLSNISGFQNALGTSSGDFAAAEIYTGGGTVSIINSAFHHNGDWGIYVDLNGGSLLPMTGVTWTSNNWDGFGFDGTDNPNVEVVP